MRPLKLVSSTVALALIAESSPHISSHFGYEHRPSPLIKNHHLPLLRRRTSAGQVRVLYNPKVAQILIRSTGDLALMAKLNAQPTGMSHSSTSAKARLTPLVKTALRAIQRLSDPDTQQRNPLMRFLLVGTLWLREATRRRLASLVQEPPRNNRDESMFGPGGFLAGEFL